MAKMLALELAKHGVRVNVICPGAIESQIDDNTQKRNVEKEKEPAVYPAGTIPLTDGKPGKAEDVADLVLFLGLGCLQNTSPALKSGLMVASRCSKAKPKQSIYCRGARLCAL